MGVGSGWGGVVVEFGEESRREGRKCVLYMFMDMYLYIHMYMYAHVYTNINIPINLCV